MKASFTRNNKAYSFDLNKPTADLSMAVSDIARAWYIEAPIFSPVKLGDWTGSVEAGNSVNFFNVKFNPHAHGTHTETAGHITKERHSINTHYNDPIHWAMVLTMPVREGKVAFADFQAQWNTAEAHGWTTEVTAIILRTENDPSAAQNRNYSNTDWPYLDGEIGSFLRDQGIDHLLIDQPSVDQEEDGGKLECHHAFWGPSPELSLHRTITEFVNIPAAVEDGPYLLHLQVAPFENDAAPSRPLIYGPCE